MNEIMKNKDYMESMNIIDAEDRSSDGIDRVRLSFKSGHKLSVVRGPWTYGGDEGLYEIAPYNTSGGMDGAVLGFDGDDVLGYLTVENVKEKILEMSKL